MTSDDIRCQLMTSDVLLLNFLKVVVKIFHDMAKGTNRAKCLFVSLSVSEFMVH